ncbi:MAG: hypothetical protein A3E78_10475 [Alphaproteobacteria bacterium RIFCSPHIGHO2_12_FULL_63_12]|nr:MAG: hypothetical protein A3E78_10475 [Alphaproteobacteria bacterium RIFCSPHIGHO2_12_FULL_63_12]
MPFDAAAPMIGPNDIFALSAVMTSLAFLGVWLDGTWLGKRTSGVVWVIVIGTALANFHFIPLKSPVYDFIGAYFVPLSIPLLLFKADLKRVVQDGGPVMLAFAVASIGVFIGAVLGYFIFDLGEIGPKVAGVYAAGWIGGSVNFVAVAKAVELTPEQFATAISASAGVSIAGLMILLALPSIPLIRRLVPSKVIEETESAPQESVDEAAGVRFRLPHVAGAIAASFVICALSGIIAASLGIDRYSIMIVTLLAIVVANIFPRTLKRLEGDFELGVYAMYLFFASIGASSDAVSFIQSAPILLVYGLFILAIFLVFFLTAARLLKIDLAYAVIGASSAFVGAAPAAAVASAHGWKDLVTPGVMCGILGYVIATFIGVGLSGLLGGIN